LGEPKKRSSESAANSKGFALFQQEKHSSLPSEAQVDLFKNKTRQQTTKNHGLSLMSRL